jgi:peptidoglycan/xylan/chitin deacetylase (PgdA/CDA1 family)
MLIAVNYHYVRPVFDAPHPGIHGITPDQFESQLQTLARAGTFVSAANIREALRGDAPLPARALVVTFDDGLREQFEQARPVLARLGIPAIFFINTQPIADETVSSVHKIHLLRANLPVAEFGKRLGEAAERQAVRLDLEVTAPAAIEHYKYDEPAAAQVKYVLNFVLNESQRQRIVDRMFEEVFPQAEAPISRRLYMDRAQLRELAGEGMVGTHGHEHLPLGLIADRDADQQIRQSLELLADWTGARPFALSYPYGSREASSPAVAQAAARRGIEFAFTMERAGNRDLDSPLHLARFDNNDLPGGKASRWTIEELFEMAGTRSWHTA